MYSSLVSTGTVRRLFLPGIENSDSSWRIYEINKSGTIFKKDYYSQTEILPLSQFGNAAYKFVTYDDIDPVYFRTGK